jgi:hypothetical protein
MRKTFCFLIFFVSGFIFSVQLAAQHRKIKLPEFKKDPPYTVQFRDTFHLFVIGNYPEHSENLNILLNPAYVDLYGLNVNMGYEASVHYTRNKFSFWAGYRGSYYELVIKNTIAEDNSLGGPADGLATAKNIEIGAEYNYVTRKETNEELIKLGRHGGYSFSRRMQADYLLNYGYRFGVQYFETYISGDQVPFSGYFISDPRKRIINFGLGQVGTVMQENIINLGASMTNTHDLLVKNQWLGKKRVAYKTYIYGDLMFAPAMVYSNVIMKSYPNLSRLQYTDFDINTATPKSRFGARVGFTYYDLSTIGLTFGLEAGLRPGPNVATGFYAMAKFGVSINAKIKQ